MEDWTQLLDEMGASHRALLAFDGAAFARHLERETELIAALTSRPPASLASHLEELLRTRRSLLSAIRRTVLALRGANLAATVYNANGQVV